MRLYTRNDVDRTKSFAGAFLPRPCRSALLGGELLSDQNSPILDPATSRRPFAQCPPAPKPNLSPQFPINVDTTKHVTQPHSPALHC